MNKGAEFYCGAEHYAEAFNPYPNALTPTPPPRERGFGAEGFSHFTLTFQCVMRAFFIFPALPESGFFHALAPTFLILRMSCSSPTGEGLVRAAVVLRRKERDENAANRNAEAFKPHPNALTPTPLPRERGFGAEGFSHFTLTFQCVMRAFFIFPALPESGFFHALAPTFLILRMSCSSPTGEGLWSREVLTLCCSAGFAMDKLRKSDMTLRFCQTKDIFDALSPTPPPRGWGLFVQLLSNVGKIKYGRTPSQKVKTKCKNLSEPKPLPHGGGVGERAFGKSPDRLQSATAQHTIKAGKSTFGKFFFPPQSALYAKFSHQKALIPQKPTETSASPCKKFPIKRYS